MYTYLFIYFFIYFVTKA